MAYVVVVFAIINTAALLGAAYYILVSLNSMVEIVGTTMADEIRKQDDRIEKRLQRAQGQPEDPVPTPTDARLTVGQPFRR